MTVRVSVGAAGAALDGILAELDTPILYIYTGTQPTSSNSAPTGTLLGKISLNGADATNSANCIVLSRTDNTITLGSGSFRMTGVAAGTAGWARLANHDDSLSSSTSAPRIDGSIAVTGGNYNISSLTVAVGSPHTLDSLTITFPLA